MLGETAIPFEFAGVTAGNLTRGLRPYGSPTIEVPSAESYFYVMENMEIVLDESTIAQLDELINERTVVGNRYSTLNR